MPLHPQCAAVIEAAKSSGASVFDTRDPEVARQRYNASTAVYNPPTPALDKVESLLLPNENGLLPLRFYTPTGGAAPRPALLYFHGGGWVFGNLESHDAMCRILAHESDCVVVSVDYRLAPEDRFPAAIEDCLWALRWVERHGADQGVDPARLAVGGDSAGGNLAAVVAQATRETGPALKFQLLIYPAVDFTADTESLRANGEGYLLTRGAMAWTRDCYLTTLEDRNDPRASPLLAADFSGLPPALVQTAGYDPLRDEGRAYADRLEEAGVPVSYRCYEDMVHGFMRMGALVDEALVALGDAGRAVKEALYA